jgi:hypothetical protein
MSYRSYFVQTKSIGEAQRPQVAKRAAPRLNLAGLRSQSWGKQMRPSNIMKRRADYGIDAPGVVRIHIILGFLLALLAAAGLTWPQPNPIPFSLSIGAVAFAALLLFVAAVMLWSSLVAKKRVRDRLVAALALKGRSAYSTPVAAAGWR